ncbi:MAG: hypothetical protein GY832_26145 [Chloroflexi bacterium]|nr:hypothetical protein [Chloroflexota bacterium]
MTFATYEQVAELRADIAQLKTVAAGNQRSTFLSALLAQSGVDGTITPGDIFTGLGFTGLFTGLGGGCGAALGIFASTVFHQSSEAAAGLIPLGAASGFLVGAVVVGWKLYKDYTFVAGPEMPAQEVISASECGKPISYPKKAGGFGFITLLPDVKISLIDKMIQETARLYFSNRSKDAKDKAFSKRKLGRPFGERVGQAQKILEQAGLIEDTANNTYLFTHRGRDWLAEYY